MSAYKIAKQFKTSDIIVIEKEERFGGRIQTLPISKDINLELGAGIFFNNNYEAINLVKELGLESKLFYKKTKSIKQHYKLKFNENKYNVEKIINLDKSDFMTNIDTLDTYKKYNNVNNNISNFSLYRIIEKIMGIDTAICMTAMHGYDGDFTSQNATDGIEMLKREYNSNMVFLTGGMTQIIDKLVEKLQFLGVKLYLGVEFLNINKLNGRYRSLVVYNNNKYFIYSDNIILAMPKKPLMKIPFLYQCYPLLNSVASKALMRVYLIFGNNNGWLKDIEGTVTTNTIIRQIILINKEKGIVMIYVSDENATHLNDMYKNNMLEIELLFNLRKIFKNVPKPKEMYVKFWKDATHVWKPTIESYKESINILKPLKDERIFIVGEAYSQWQQWIEGAVLSVKNLMKIL